MTKIIDLHADFPDEYVVIEEIYLLLCIVTHMHL